MRHVVGPLYAATVIDKHTMGVVDDSFNLYVMNSHENANKLISAFKKEYKAGMDPNDVIDYVLDKYDINEDFFTDADVIRINREMLNFCRYGV